MTTTVFVDGVTLTQASWFNDIDALAYPSTSVVADRYGSGMTTTPGADINAAITAAGAGVVLLPAGSFSIETSILLASNIVLVGQGVGATVLTAATGLNSPVITNATAISVKTISGITRSGRTATATSVAHGYSNGNFVFISGVTQQAYNGVQQIFNVAADTFDFYVEKTTTSPATTAGTMRVYRASNSNLGVQDLEIVGNALNTSGDNNGIRYQGVENFFLRRVFVHDTYHNGIAILSGANGVLEACRSEGAIHAQHNGYILGSTNAGPSSGYSYVAGIHLDGCQGNLNGQDGFVFQAGRGVTVVNCQARRNVITGFKPCQTSQISITACFSERNGGPGMQLQAALGASDIIFNANICRENGEGGILIGQADTALPSTQVSVTNNICAWNGQIASAAPYGIAIELTASCTINGLIVTGNNLANQPRGLSFGVDGTVSNAVVVGNNTEPNSTTDFNAGASLDLATAVLGPNNGITGAIDAIPALASHQLRFWADNVTAAAGTTFLSDGLGGRGYVMSRAGWYRSTNALSNAATTVGSITFQPKKNGSNFTSNLTVSSGTFNSQTETPKGVTFAAGDIIRCAYTSTAGLLPTGTNDFDVILEVVYT